MPSFCPKCQTAARATARYCSICGNSLYQSMLVNEDRGYRSVLRNTNQLEPEFRQQFEQALLHRSYSGYAQGRQRSVTLVMLMPLFTFGLYGIYWWWRSGQEIRQALGSGEPNPPRDIFLLILTFGLWRLVMHYNYAARIVDLQERHNLPRCDYLKYLCPMLSLCLMGTLSIGIMQQELNRIWAAQHGHE